MTTTEPTPCSVSCATLEELMRILNNGKYTNYHRAFAITEARSRGLSILYVRKESERGYRVSGFKKEAKNAKQNRFAIH